MRISTNFGTVTLSQWHLNKNLYNYLYDNNKSFLSNRVDTNADMFHWLMLSSDPGLSIMSRRKEKAVHHEYTEEIKTLVFYED